MEDLFSYFPLFLLVAAAVVYYLRMGSSRNGISSARRSFSPILDQYSTLPQVQQALRRAGLESSNLIVGVDFTKSNEWTGERSFQKRCLHTLLPKPKVTPAPHVKKDAASESKGIKTLRAKPEKSDIFVNVKTLANQTWRYAVHKDTKVLELKQWIEVDHQMVAPCQRFIYAGREMIDTANIFDASLGGCKAGDTIMLVLRAVPVAVDTNENIIHDKYLNPYEQALAIIGRTLSVFDDDGIIPFFGFGDSRTGAREIFNVKTNTVGNANRSNASYCKGIGEVLQSYRKIVDSVTLSGPTNFAPLIDEAIRITEAENGYHILLIIADGQVTKEKETIASIVRASNYPLSIVMVGVGDGPWGQMEVFDDKLPQRRFDNFQFVSMESLRELHDKDGSFAVAALQEIPDQYKAIQSLGLLN